MFPKSALIVDSVKETYLGELCNKYAGSLGVTARDLLDHLLDRYEKIHWQILNSAKQKCTNRFLTPHSQSISASNESTTVYNNTWANFKQIFAADHCDCKEQDKVNSSQNKSHGANAAVNITQALDNLALAAISDCDFVAQLTAVNQQLTTATNANLSAQLKMHSKTNTILVNKLSFNQPLPSAAAAASPGTHQQPPFHQAAWIASLDPNGYCWSHGYRVVTDRTSANCKGKLRGHIHTVTCSNPNFHLLKVKIPDYHSAR